MKTTTLNIEAELAKFEAEQRAALGLEPERTQWRDEMISPHFTASQRAHTTMLIGGLTMVQDFIVEGAFKGLGYRTRALDCPDVKALQVGKEFGNRGQCNPTYFTVGSLIQELVRLRDEEGMSPSYIIEHYLFMTAGACGPCRFGMYVTEYRKALRDAGFDGFRVLLFQQTGGIKQATGEELGLVLDQKFFITLGEGLFAGEIINLLGYRLRPFEVEAGATDRAVDAAKREIYRCLEHRTSILAAIWRCRKIFAAVEVDRLKPKPSVAVIGEFWAMTTEGDGNYHLQEFLQKEGAEVGIQCIVNLLLYNLWEFRHDTMMRMELKGADRSKFGLADSDVGLTLAGLFLGEIAMRIWWQSWAHLMGLYGHKLPDMDEVARAGHDYYNKELRGGEGHLEVAKLILNVVHNKATMTLSVKPFGCMPSSGVSDGVQSLVTERFPEAIYCAVETSGDGAVNFYSRVQMYLFKARQRAQAEFDEALALYGVTEEQVRAELRGSRFAHPLHHAPHHVSTTGANVIHEVAPFIGKSRLGRAGVHAKQITERITKLITEDGAWAARTLREVAPFLPALLRRSAIEIRDIVPAADELYRRALSSLVRPSEEEREAISRAEEAPEPARVVERDFGGLHVVA